MTKDRRRYGLFFDCSRMFLDLEGVGVLLKGSGPQTVFGHLWLVSAVFALRFVSGQRASPALSSRTSQRGRHG